MTADLPLFHVCFPEQESDTWHEQRAESAEDAATALAERRCDEDCGWYIIFDETTKALVREDGASCVSVFDVTVEQVPVFSATLVNSCRGR